jgi:hypothetical protein
MPGVRLRPLVYRASQAALAPGARSSLTAALRRWSEIHDIGDAVLDVRAGAFDSVWSFGLLHHLPDDATGAAVREMRRVTTTAGSTVVFDGVLLTCDGSHLAHLVRRLDRGRWMRSRQALTTLVDGLGAQQREPVRYSALGLEGVLATWNGR